MHSSPQVAVIGGGPAGLTSAYLLAKSFLANGLDPSTIHVFEGSERLGGRIVSNRSYFPGITVEQGAEFIDSNHHALIALGKEIGVRVSKFYPAHSRDSDLYLVNDNFYLPKDLFEPISNRSMEGFVRKVTTDYGAVFPLEGSKHWRKHLFQGEPPLEKTPRGEQLDAMSVRDYLREVEATTTPQLPGWGLRLIESTYASEFGVSTDSISALALVEYFNPGNVGRNHGHTKPKSFFIYGNSDEVYHIKGGFEKLITALHTQLQQMGVNIHLNQPLQSIDAPMKNGDVVLHFADSAVAQADYVINTMPFYALKKMPGIAALVEDGRQEQLLHGMQYGKHLKISCLTEGEPWKKLPHWNGTLLSDKPYLANCWGRKVNAAHGMVTFLIGGKTTEKKPEKVAHECMLDFTRLVDTPRRQVFSDTPPCISQWNPSYSVAAPGQYYLLDYAAAPMGGGKIFIAGEHADRQYNGYVNGAIRSGKRAVDELCQAMGIEPAGLDHALPVKKVVAR